MRPRASARWVLAAAAFLAAAPSSTLLDVPYVPQSELLCGGAAAAMVMRYWGAHDVYADTFAPLVDRAAGGITTDALAAELRRRSWTVSAGAGTTDDIGRELGRGRPVIALVDAGRGRFHYVVLVSMDASKVVLHDPARAPFRVVDTRAFDASWAKSGRWMLVLLPPGGKPVTESTTTAPDSGAASPDASACAARVREGVSAAAAGDTAGARRRLEAAVAACPSDAAAWRELAGLDALEARWADARSHARSALLHDPHDEYAWRTLATAEYVRHQDRAALDAWNHVGEPRVDLVRVDGLSRMRYDVANDAIRMAPGTLVSDASLRMAQRRLESIPSIAAARVSFQPSQHGRAQVDAAVVERAAAPLGYAEWLGTGLRAASERELGTAFANVTGGGELLSVSWRWWEHRPMIAGSFAAPAPRWFGGTWRVAALRETATFGADRFQETRTHVDLTTARWVTSTARVEAGFGIDRWTAAGRTGSAIGRVEFRSPDARTELSAGGAAFASSHSPFATVDAALRWRSRAERLGRVWLADGGVQLASSSTPEMLWPAADTGHARAVLLRAHPLLEDGIITRGVFGRHLVHASAEVDQWFRARRWPLSLAPAGFVDVARASDGFRSTDTRVHVDVGAGVRLAILGSGVLRLDAAHGLRDGRNALSIGWVR